MQNNFEKKTEAFLNQDQLVFVNIIIKKLNHVYRHQEIITTRRENMYSSGVWIVVTLHILDSLFA